jgi:Fe2+ or Zn2+ uptake regulation protein
MTRHLASEYFEKFLITHHVKPTSRRVQILKIVFEVHDTEFSFREIYTLIKKEDPLAGISSTADTLTLFKNTGLIKEVNPIGDTSQSNRKKGRPERKFISTNLLRW